MGYLGRQLVHHVHVISFSPGSIQEELSQASSIRKEMGWVTQEHLEVFGVCKSMFSVLLCFFLPVSHVWLTGWRSCWGDREELKSSTIVLPGARQDVQSFMRSHPSLLPPTLRRAPLPHTCANTNVLKAHSRVLLNSKWLVNVVSCTPQALHVQSPPFSIPIT